MPAAVPVAGVVRVNLLWTDGIDLHLSSKLNWRYTGPAPSVAGVAAIAEAIYVAAHDNFLGQMYNGNDLIGVDVIDLSADDAHTAVYMEDHGGSRGSAELPAETAVLLNHHIARRYRGGKPRNYLPWFIATDLDTPQSWKESSIVGAQGAWNAFVAELASITGDGTDLTVPCSVSYFKGYDTPRTRSNGHLLYPPRARETPVVDTIISSSINPIPSSQRRRNMR